MKWVDTALKVLSFLKVLSMAVSLPNTCDYWAVKNKCSPDITLSDAVDRVDQAINVQEAKTTRVRDGVCSNRNRIALQDFIDCSINRAKSSYRCLTFHQLVNDTLWQSKVTPTTVWRDSSGLIERVRLISNNPAFNTLANILILLFPGSTLCDDEQRMYDYAEYRYCMLDYSGYMRSPKCVTTEAFLAIDNSQSTTMCTFFEKVIDCVLIGIQSTCKKSALNGLKTFYADWIGKEIRRIFQQISRLKDVPFSKFDVECDPLAYISKTLDNWNFTPIQQSSAGVKGLPDVALTYAALLLLVAHRFVLIFY